jgi:site-specific recombinase XerC
MTGFPASQRRKDFRCCSIFRALSARSTKNEFTLWARSRLLLLQKHLMARPWRSRHTVLGYGTHSMRRTKVVEIYRKTGNLRAVQLLLGHTKVDSTVRYLGVELEDALSISERIDL